MRDHWDNCIIHKDQGVAEFIQTYFGDPSRQCLLVAAAGFDPRSQRVARLLSATLSDRLSATFIREERGAPSQNLRDAGDENERQLRTIVPSSDVVPIHVFSDDEAPVGGIRAARELHGRPLPSHVTDVVLDMTALSIGIGFPAARVLLEACEARPHVALHLMIASNPALDDRITAEPTDRPMSVHGFSGMAAAGTALEVATIWVPMLAHGRGEALVRIGASIGARYKVCPLLPFPAGNPRRADELLAEYESQLVEDWEADPRDLVFVSDSNPLDCYRTLSTLKKRYDRTVENVYTPQVIVSPIGSRVMAAGALMAAIEHDLPVHYIETVRYELLEAPRDAAAAGERLVHLILSGPIYGDYNRAIDTVRS